jgi:hypothetical protein
MKYKRNLLLIRKRKENRTNIGAKEISWKSARFIRDKKG